MFLPKNLADAAQSKYGEFFLTSRGVIQLSLNTLYEQYGYKEQAELFSRLTRQFDQIIAPLIPLEIVFNGFHFFFYFTITEEAESLRLNQLNVLIDANFQFQDALNALSGSTRQLAVPNQIIRAIIRPLKQTAYRFDEMPLDAWALDLHHTPPIIPVPFGTQPDPRLTLLDNQIWITTGGHYGCLVSLRREGTTRYSFPSWAEKACLPIPAEKIAQVEKITYCVMPECILYEVPLAVQRDVVRLKRTIEQVRIRTIPEQDDTVASTRFNTQLSPPIRLKEHNDLIRLTHMAEQLLCRALVETRETLENTGVSMGLSARLAQIKFKAIPHLTMTETRLFYAIQLKDKCDTVHLKQTTEQANIGAIAETRESVGRIGFNTGLSSQIAPIELKASPRLAMTATHLFYALPLNEKLDTVRLEQTTRQSTLGVIPEPGGQLKKRQSDSELTFSLKPAEFKSKTTHFTLDEVPLDMWALDINALASPVFMGDSRLREESGRIMLAMTGQRGCLVHYADGKMGSYEFPPGATEVQLPSDGLHTFKDIMKIVFV
ncbi:hypothetical protein ID852_03320 [Xenorhabdus sp. 42]|uniref:hypothetical protein n=1 Tax=Xenorhabdus szentirmaii TaxID=290112 RepID=UPI0019ADA754|nr:MULTISPECIES: hypothetical protein [unclassified Xenorhabdus]MBD2782229.1 hypothetical protein [Xenorhabdus sp. 38]MBD2819738.1 hypothetical protein [Xenorhabdus sp. 42]